MCFWRLFSRRRENEGTGWQTMEVQIDLANSVHSDEFLVNRVKNRLRKLGTSHPAHHDEIEDIIQGDVEDLARRLKDIRRNFRSHMESPAALRKEWVDLIKDMQQRGERGEAEAAEWVLQNFYEFLQGKITQPSPRARDNDSRWKDIKRDTITRDAIMEVFSESKNDNSLRTCERNSGQAEENEIIVFVDREIEDDQSKAMMSVAKVGVESFSPQQSASNVIESTIELDQDGAINTTASYMFKADGTKRECPSSVNFSKSNTPKVLGDQTFEVRLGWDIDIVLLATIPEVGNMPLLVIVHYIIMQTSLNTHLKLDMDRVNNWVRDIEESYLDNPYHNHLHAADVVCSMYHWFNSKFFKENMTSVELLASLMAAAAHDVGHDAVNNRFHIMTRSRLGTRYNDRSPLENYHTCLSFELLYKPDNNWFHSFTMADQSYLRSLIIELIIGTDMNYHQYHVDNIMDLSSKVELPMCLEDPPVKLRGKNEGEFEDLKSRISREPCEKVMILKAGLHIADISNPAKPKNICVYWAKKVVQEFLEQGDKEQARGLPISPLCDRKTSNMAEGQKGFIKFVVRPIFEPWVKLMPEAQIAMTCLKENLEYWDQRRKFGSSPESFNQTESKSQVSKGELPNRTKTDNDEKPKMIH